MKDAKVSVVLPIYNQELNLGISLPSVINQTWKNIEIIAVNDGSTDSSLNIIKKYQESDPRFVVINKKNGGLVDATIAGIEAATGDYICFVDPDDVVGNDFIKNFMIRIGDADFISMGFFENNGHNIFEYHLRENRVYEKNEIQKFKKIFLFDKITPGVNNSIFISRWNKLYKMNLVKKILSELKTITSVSLGEDTIFTFLVLNHCDKFICFAEPNCYIYNTDSTTSMMKNNQAINHIEKAKIAYDRFSILLNKYGESGDQAVALYYFLISSLIARMKTFTNDDLSEAYKLLHKDNLYKSGVKLVKQNGLKNAIHKLTWLCPNQAIYCLLYNNLKNTVYPLLKNAKSQLKEPVIFIKDTVKKGVINAAQLSKHRSKRRKAFKDIKKYLPTLEKQIQPTIDKWKNITTDFNNSPIEKNIFVFWWDGFDKCPHIVRECLNSIKHNHAGYSIIEIDKTNFRDYTDIHPAILDGFADGTISVQTFSDILRFNLLKNNGGIWIDSTIFFAKPFNLLSGLENNSINSLEFNSSKYFLEYKNQKCTWSGYYFASRKNSVFVNVMNDIFESYYLEYHKYPIYFFIDAALMLCKINKIDNDALSKTTKTWADMDFLGNHLNMEYSESGAYIASIVPQKLCWFAKINTSDENNYYRKIIKNGND